MSNHEHRDPPDAGRDADLRRAWQQASDELPPPQLDAAIVAAARSSVQQRGDAAPTARAGTPARKRWMQWQPLAAAATVAGLAFVLLQLMPRERDVAPSIRIEDSAPARARPDVAAPPAIERAEMDGAAAEPGAVEAKALPAMDRAAAGQTAAQPGAAADAVVEPEGVGEAASESFDAATGAADWAARIAALYDSGDTAEAADMLRAFRAAEPDADAYLPESMRDWARSVP